MGRIVIVGASLAGHHVASTLRRLGYDGAITMIGQEPHAPYDRYPLSKGFLRGETTRAQLDLNPIVPEVDWRLGQTATALDLVHRRLTLEGKARVHFDGLVIATGVRPRALQRTPRMAGAFVLRTVEDAAALLDVLAAERRRVVIVGGGLIGAEVASVAAEAGHDTTLVHSGRLPMSSSVGTLVASRLLRLHHSAGVRVERETRVLGLGQIHGRVTNVQLATSVGVTFSVVKARWKNRRAASPSRRLETRMSMTCPCWSTARCDAGICSVRLGSGSERRAR